MAIIRDQKTGRIWRRMTVKTVVNGGDRTNGARIERTIRMGRLSSAALFNRAAPGSSSATAAVAVAAYADGFVVPPAVAGCSSFSVRLARTWFACRQCHDLTYRCVQEHDKRLDWLVKAPDWLLMDLMEHSECPWRLLAIRGGYVKLGILGKY